MMVKRFHSGNFKLKFEFDKVPTPTLQKISGSHFRIEDEFGYIKIGTNKYRIHSMDIYARSLHRLVGKTFPMEIIFSAKLLEKEVIKKNKSSKKSNKKQADKKKVKKPIKLLKFSFFFEEAKIPYVELYTLGLGRDIIRYMPTKRKDPLHSMLDLHTTFDVLKLTDNYKKVIWYNARSTMDNCKMVKFLILFDVLWIGTDQLTEFYNPIEKRVQTTDKLTSQLSANFMVTA